MTAEGPPASRGAGAEVRRPEPDEYAVYYGPYVDAVPEGSILDLLERQRLEAEQLLAAVPPSRETFRYAPGKWSARELLGHVVDSERMFAMRALAFARKDPGPLPSFDENEYAEASDADGRSLADIASEFDAVRMATVHLFASLRPEAWDRRGIASDCEFSVRSLAWIIGGHAAHHLGVLRERYLEGS